MARDRKTIHAAGLHRESIASGGSTLLGGACGRPANRQAHQAITAASHTDPMANVCDANRINGKLLTGCSPLHKGHASTWRKSRTVRPAAHIGKSQPIENAEIRSRRIIPRLSKWRTLAINGSRPTGQPSHATMPASPFASLCSGLDSQLELADLHRNGTSYRGTRATRHNGSPAA